MEQKDYQDGNGDSRDMGAGGTSDETGGAGQHQFLLHHEQNRHQQQQQQIDHFHQSLQSNTDYLSSFLGNPAGMPRPTAPGGPAAMVGSNPMMPSAQNIGAATGANDLAPLPIQQHQHQQQQQQQQMDPSSMRQQEMMALMEAQRRNVNMNAFNPALLQQFQSQQQQMEANAAHNQMMMNHQNQQNNPGMLQQHDPLMLGNMLHQARGMGAQQMPMEAQSLFSNQMASRMAMMAGNPMAPSPVYQRRINPEEELKLAGNRGTIEPFPEKLHRLLMETEKAGMESVISFTDNGKAFEIHKPDRFFKEIVPNYFKQSRLSSFKRQLNLYGFELIATGPTRGGYSHEKFLKDQPELCRQIRRRDIKFNSRPKSNKWEINAPDFYNMPPITASQNAKETTTDDDDKTNEQAAQAEKTASPGSDA